MPLFLSPVLSMLRAIPWWAYLLAGVLCWGGWQRHRANSAANTLQHAQAAAAIEREQALAATIAETARRLAAQQQVNQHADRQLALARRSAVSADAAAVRLRQQLTAIRAGAAAGDTAVAGASQAGGLADLLDRCAGRYRTVAAAADRAVVAGLACEASYEALTRSPILPADLPALN